MQDATPSPLTESALHVIHKYLRAELFKVSEHIACADALTLAVVQQQLHDIAALLRGHGQHEDQSFEAVLRAYDPLLANTLEDDHLKLEAALQRILDRARSLSTLPREEVDRQLQYLYLDWNQFVGHYLLHLDDEERLLFVAISEHMPEIAVIQASIDSVEDEQRRAFIATLKKVTSPHEQQLIFSNPPKEPA